MRYRYERHERYERYDRRPRWSPFRRWLTALTVMVWILLVGLLLAHFVARPLLTTVAKQRFARRLPVIRPAGIPLEPGQVAPIAAEPGSFVIAEGDANQWLLNNRQVLQGVDDIRLRFTPGEVQADLTVGGVTSTARAGVQVADGRVEVVNPRLDPPLGLIVDVEPFAALVQERLNTDIEATGHTVTGVAVEQGQVVITIE